VQGDTPGKLPGSILGPGVLPGRIGYLVLNA